MGQYDRTLDQQAYKKFSDMFKAGEGVSRHDADKDTLSKVITSSSTFHTYYDVGRSFSAFVRAEHPDVTSLKHAKQYVGDFLQKGINDGKSPWTLKTERSALNKLYGIKPGTHYFVTLPERRTGHESNNRGTSDYMKHFSEKNHSELVDFCKGTGARRTALEHLTGDCYFSHEDAVKAVSRLEGLEKPTERDLKDLGAIKDALAVFPNEKDFVLWREDKGGKTRLSPIQGSPDKVARIRDRIEGTDATERVWKHVPDACPVHRYRADYCKTVYEKYARDPDEMKKDRYNPGIDRYVSSEVYYCRGENRGKHLDKQALEKASKACGHNRLEVTARSYLQAL